MRRALHFQLFSAISNGLCNLLQDILGQGTISKALGWCQLTTLARLQLTLDGKHAVSTSEVFRQNEVKLAGRLLSLTGCWWKYPLASAKESANDEVQSRSSSWDQWGSLAHSSALHKMKGNAFKLWSNLTWTSSLDPAMPSLNGCSTKSTSSIIQTPLVKISSTRPSSVVSFCSAAVLRFDLHGSSKPVLPWKGTFSARSFKVDRDYMRLLALSYLYIYISILVPVDGIDI